MTLKTAPWAKLVFASAVATLPAVLSYCKSTQEADAQHAHGQREAGAGYKALAESVKHLELVVAAQSAAIRLLTDRTSTGGTLPVPTAALEFPDLPDSPAAALRQQAAAE